MIFSPQRPRRSQRLKIILSFIRNRAVKIFLTCAWWPKIILLFINLTPSVYSVCSVVSFCSRLSLAINASLNMTIIGLLVVKRKGNILALVLTLTSFPFLSLLANGSIEWIPALGFIFQNQYGIPLLLTKPQSGIFSTLSWIQSAKHKGLFILPTVLITAVSFFVWKNWLEAILANIQYMNNAKIGLFTVSVSPFPWGIPLGLGLIYYVLKYKPKNSELFGTLSTFFLVPYFVPHSLTILFALLSVSYRRIAIVSWLLLWLYPFLNHWGYFLHMLGVR